MSVDGFPPPADECSCLVDDCDWLDQDCCITKYLEVDEPCRAQGLVQCPNLLAHYSKQHSITAAAAWRPSTFTFRVPKHPAGSPCLGPWSPCLSPSLHTPGLAWWLHGVITGSDMKLIVKVADQGLTGLTPYWLIKPEKNHLVNKDRRETAQKMLKGNPSEDLCHAKIIKKEKSSWVDITKGKESKVFVWIEMDVSFSFTLKKVNLDGRQLMIQLYLGKKAWEMLGYNTPKGNFNDINIDQALADLEALDEQMCEPVKHEEKEKIKEDLNNETGEALLESSEKCEICAEKPKPGKYLSCPGEARHKFCFPCWDAMAIKRFFVSADVFCPVCQNSPNICGEEMPWSCKESDKRTLMILSQVESDTLRDEKLKELKEKRDKKRKKSERTVIKSEDTAGGQDPEEDLEIIVKKFLANKSYTHEENIKLIKKGQEEKKRTTGARPKVKSTIYSHLPQEEKSQIFPGRLSQPIEGKDEIKIVLETVEAITACEHHVDELLTRVAKNRSQTILCLNCQALWCQNCISRCGRCMKATYCDEVCQASDWEIHRPLCNEESEEEEMGAWSQ